MASEVKMPVVAHRSRVPSEPGMLGHYPWSYLDGAPRLSQSSYERELLVLQSDALAAIEAARVEADTLRKERDEARRAKTGHFSSFYLLANARRIQSAATARDPNWVLAMNLFAVGSTTAQAICRENGIDPDATVVRSLAKEAP